MVVDGEMAGGIGLDLFKKKGEWRQQPDGGGGREAAWRDGEGRVDLPRCLIGAVLGCRLDEPSACPLGVQNRDGPKGRNGEEVREGNDDDRRDEQTRLIGLVVFEQLPWFFLEPDLRETEAEM